MGLVDNLHGKLVAVDTSPLIFYIEEHKTFGPVLDPLFGSVCDGNIHLLTSTVTLLEVLVQPLRNNDEPLAQKYNDILLIHQTSAPFL